MRVKRTMFVGKIADVPRPASAAPIVAVVSLATISETPVSNVTAQMDISAFSDSRREITDAKPRPRTMNEKNTTAPFTPSYPICLSSYE